MKRVLITGVAGFIGMHAAIRFLKEGYRVIGVDNMNNYYSVELKKNRLEQIRKTADTHSNEFKFYENDLNSDVWLELSKFNLDIVLHLAAQAGVRFSIENPLTYLESNILGFQRVLDFVVENKVSQFLFASSSSVYGKNSKQPFTEMEPCDSPESYYAATKRANELMAHSYYKTHNLSSTALRFFTVYGPWGRPDMAPMLFLKAAFGDGEISVYNHGNQKRDFTYIDDIVEGIFGLSRLDQERGAVVYNIGHGSPSGLLEFIELVETLSHRKLNKKYVSSQKGDVEITFADISKLKKLIKYKPTTNLRDGLEKLVDWYKDYYGI